MLGLTTNTVRAVSVLVGRRLAPFNRSKATYSPVDNLKRKMVAEDSKENIPAQKEVKVTFHTVAPTNILMFEFSSF